MPFCTPHNWSSVCREGKGCTPRRSVSPCREGRGCSLHSRVSPSRGGRGCILRTCLSACRGGRGCSLCRSFSASRERFRVGCASRCGPVASPLVHLRCPLTARLPCDNSSLRREVAATGRCTAARKREGNRSAGVSSFRASQSRLQRSCTAKPRCSARPRRWGCHEP